MSGSRGFDEQDVRAAAGSVFDRADRTAKAQRASHLGSMFAGIDCQPRWRERLGEITVPTLVVHGDEDPFFPHGNGVALAAEIPGATLLTLPGIGQGVPRVTWPEVVDALLRHTSDTPRGSGQAGLPLAGWVEDQTHREAPLRRMPSMSRRSVLASGSAVAAVAAVMLAGCKIQPTDAAGSTTGPDAVAAQSGSSAVSRSGSLIVEPAAGFSPVYHLINGARHSIDVTMYEFADTTAEHDLAAAARRGVRIEVILDHREQSENSGAYSYFKSHGIKVVWSSSSYRYTHQKTIVVDGSEAVIMTANLTSRYYSTSRDFLVLDSNHADVSAITTVFNADFAHRSVRPGDGSDLVWSPTDSQDQMLGLIDGATRSLRIYSEEMGDTTVENALIKAAKRGVDVQICGENEDGEYDSAFARLARAGIHISYYSSSTGFYIHGKVIEADYGTSRAKVFIGSENFSSTSLNENRELGLITSSHAVMSAIASTFASDFAHGKHV
jgi:cardiolipin synthase A/B